MLRRPTITDARGRSVPLIAHEMFARDPGKRAHLKHSGWTLGPKGPLILVLLVLTLFVFAVLPAIIARRLNAPQWVQMSTVVLPAIVSTVGTIFWSRRLAPKQIAQTYLDAQFCPSCGYDLANIPPDPDHLRTCPECGATWRLPSSPAPGEEMVAAQRRPR